MHVSICVRILLCDHLKTESMEPKKEESRGDKILKHARDTCLLLFNRQLQILVVGTMINIYVSKFICESGLWGLVGCFKFMVSCCDNSTLIACCPTTYVAHCYCMMVAQFLST